MNRIAIFAATIASISCIAATPAMAEGTSVEVYYGDLDTSSEAGVKTLTQRLAIGVQQACARPDTRDLKANQAWQKCREDAREHAAEQLTAEGLVIPAAG